MLSSTRLKWWQQEIEELPVTTSENVHVKEEKPDNSDKLLEALLKRLEGPKVGVQYKIEVTGKLDINDGTFWACPVSSGFIQDKLEPLSRLLRSAIQTDPGHKNVGPFDRLVCVQSSQSNAWMRGIVIQEIKNNSVKIRLVDVGRIEDHPKDTLCKVPASLATIPYMAFCCMLFEEKLNISYEERWQFNDLVNKKILNFTCEKIVEQNGMDVLVGQMETIIDKPIININERMKRLFVKSNSPNHTNCVNNLKKTDASNNKPGGSNLNHVNNNKKRDSCSKTEVSNGKSAGSNSNEIEALLQVAGPVCGVKYKVEVTSPLHANGTFWACPITSGFIRDKLEPMADLLKASVLSDSSLRNVGTLDGILCVQSKEYRLLMRGILIKDVDKKSVKLQMIDSGRCEDHLKAKLYRVPESIAAIPCMAFHCALYEDKVKLKYEERWRFADLCKKRIVEFTLERFIELDQKKLLFGKIETDLGNPGVVNVANEIKRVSNSDDDTYPT